MVDKIEPFYNFEAFFESLMGLLVLHCHEEVELLSY